LQTIENFERKKKITKKLEKKACMFFVCLYCLFEIYFLTKNSVFFFLKKKKFEKKKKKWLKNEKK